MPELRKSEDGNEIIISPIEKKSSMIRTPNITETPAFLDAIVMAQNSETRTTFINTLNEFLAKNLRGEMPFVRIESIRVVSQESGKGLNEWGTEATTDIFKHIEIKISFDGIFIDTDTLDSLARFYAYEILGLSNTFEHTGVTTGRYFEYDSFSNQELEANLSQLRKLKDAKSRVKFVDELDEEIKGMTPAKAAQELWKRRKKSVRKKKENKRIDTNTRNIIAVASKRVMEHQLSYSLIPDIEKDNLTWADGIHLHVPRSSEITDEHLYSTLDRQRLPVFSQNPEDNIVNALTLKIPIAGMSHHNSTVMEFPKHSEIDIYYFTLAILDILRSSPQKNIVQNKTSRVLYQNNGSAGDSAGSHYKFEVLEMYYSIMKQRRKAATIEDSPGQEYPYEEIIVNTIIPLGEGNLDAVKDTLLLGTGGTGKSTLLRVLEHGDIYMQLGYPIMAIGTDNANTLVSPEFEKKVRQIVNRYGVKVLAITNDCDILIQPISEVKADAKHDPVTRQFLLDKLGNMGSVEPSFRIVGSLNNANLADPAIARRVKFIYVPAFFSNPETQYRIVAKSINELKEQILEFDEGVLDVTLLDLYIDDLSKSVIDHPPAFFKEFAKTVFGRIVLRLRKLGYRNKGDKFVITQKLLADILKQGFEETEKSYPLKSTREKDAEVQEVFNQISSGIEPIYRTEATNTNLFSLYPGIENDNVNIVPVIIDGEIVGYTLGDTDSSES